MRKSTAPDLGMERFCETKKYEIRKLAVDQSLQNKHFLTKHAKKTLRFNIAAKKIRHLLAKVKLFQLSK